MRISISNIAWNPQEDDAVAAILAEYGVDAIDVAPGKYFADITKATESQIADVRQYWRDKGVEIVGMQSLLFGTQGLNVFGQPELRQRMLDYLSHSCRIGGGLGARFLVFGSPRNRDRSNLSDQQTADIAREFFRKLGDIAAEQKTTICLEPNPAIYGANFMTDADATAAVVRDIDHPAIRMQLDVGALTINEEMASEVLAAHSELVAHVHASEPQLKVLGDCGTDHEPAAAAIREYCSDKVVTIEMREDKEDPLAALERALSFANQCYGSGKETH